jgi:hypothetical protein
MLGAFKLIILMDTKSKKFKRPFLRASIEHFHKDIYEGVNFLIYIENINYRI